MKVRIQDPETKRFKGSDLGNNGVALQTSQGQTFYLDEDGQGGLMITVVEHDNFELGVETIASNPDRIRASGVRLHVIPAQRQMTEVIKAFDHGIVAVENDDQPFGGAFFNGVNRSRIQYENKINTTTEELIRQNARRLMRDGY